MDHIVGAVPRWGENAVCLGGWSHQKPTTPTNGKHWLLWSQWPPGPEHPSMWLWSQDVEDTWEEVAGTLGCLLPPSLRSNMWVTPIQMKSHRMCPIVNIILADTDLGGRVLERCLFSDVKKVRGAFLDIFGYLVVIITNPHHHAHLGKMHRKAETAKTEP